MTQMPTDGAEPGSVPSVPSVDRRAGRSFDADLMPRHLARLHLLLDGLLQGAEPASGGLDLDEDDAVLGELDAVDGAADEAEALRVPRPVGEERRELLHRLAVARALAALAGVQLAHLAAERPRRGRPGPPRQD